MSFSNRLRQLAKPSWQAQLIHPFVLALGNGTLPRKNSNTIFYRTPGFSEILRGCSPRER